MGKNGNSGIGTPFTPESLARTIGRVIQGGEQQARETIFEQRCPHCRRFLVSSGGSNDQIFIMVSSSGDSVLVCKNCVAHYVRMGYQVLSSENPDLDLDPVSELCRKIPGVKCLGVNGGGVRSSGSRRKQGFVRTAPAHLLLQQAGK